MRAVGFFFLNDSAEAVIPARYGYSAAALAGATEKPQSGSLLNCMETLPDKYRAALELHFIEEYTISQTAEILGENVSTVKQRLVRGKKLLASKLEKKTR
ncbi:MAG: RNA polymerase sigma factor [Eubacteriales bacterium]